MTAARLIVFPIKGRNWCFSRSMIQHLTSESQSTHHIPSSLKNLWTKVYSSKDKFTASNAELLIDFAADKMNRAWTALEKAPAGSVKNKIHGLGVRLLSRVNPSEIFLKSISKEVTNVEIMYPSSLNARLVRRRLRHLALRGTVMHKKYFYGSVSLLPVSSVFMVLPLPNIPFFWILFRTYSHWRALQGSEKLLELVSDSENLKSSAATVDGGTTITSDAANTGQESRPWVLKPSKELEELLQHGNVDDGLSKCSISKICKSFDLNTMDVLKYHQNSFK